MVSLAQKAVEKSGIDAEIIDLRTLDPLGLDWASISSSVQKTNALLIAEQTTRGTSIGSRIVSEAQYRLFDYLDHEIIHVTGANSSPVVSKVLERASLAGAEALETALREMDNRRGRS
jgi:2-oxoisovalerate dehydrogenase E1 component